MHPSSGEVTHLLADLKSGKQEAAEKLIPLVYDELRCLAAHYMRQERSDHTLQATALLHEAYLRLVEQRIMNWQSRAHFFAVAAQVMRRILIDYARSHHRAKRGGDLQKVPLEEELLLFSQEQSAELVALDDALERLGEMAPRQSRVVELRYFGGLTVEETAEVLGMAPKTVKRDWSVARAWLHREIGRGKGHDSRSMAADGGTV
jgi:RNA polymerase sigma factor (TIGR02999 family)